MKDVLLSIAVFGLLLVPAAGLLYVALLLLYLATGIQMAPNAASVLVVWLLLIAYVIRETRR